MDRNIATKTRALLWVKQTFEHRVNAVLTVPFIDYTVRFIRTPVERQRLFDITYDQSNLSAFISVFEPQFMICWVGGRKKELEESLVHEITSIYLGRMKMLLANRRRTVNQSREIFGELQGNLAYLIKRQVL